MTLVLILVVIALTGVGFVAYFYQRLLREAKNYERGLKMVTLQIHLPPPSDDIEAGGRDSRDIAEETISKAQVLYNILASSRTEGFKTKLYGQRHIGLEIIARKGSVRFYAAVPVSLGPVVEQAIVSAYPNAVVEEVEEQNVFSPVGKISGTIGGELELKDNYALPIATFQESKRDGLQSMLNAFANLGSEDGAAIQLLVRPAQKGWAKAALAVAAKKRDGNSSGVDKKQFAGGIIKDIGSALWKAPEAKDDKPFKEPKKLSSVEQSNIDSIEEKTRHPGFETLVRVVASSNTAAKSQAILSNIIASFALFDAPGKNGFKFSPTKNIEAFVSAFIFRMFPQQSTKMVLNSVELSTLFHLPDRQSSALSSIERQSFKQVDGPSKLAESGVLLGYNVFRGVKKEIRLSDEDRRRHMYVVGQTGTGKSVMLENLALQDMLDGRGFAFIDPHGDAVDRLLSMVPKERAEDIVYFSPADMDHPLGLNLFEFHIPEQKDFLIQEAISMLYKLYDPQHTGIIGPRYEHWFRNAALTLMSDPVGSTFIDIPKIFTDNRYAKQKLQYVTDPTVREFWEGEMAKTSDYHKSEILGWFVSKFGAFMSNEMMRNIIGQTKSSFDLRKIMDEGKILFVNLSKGRTGELNSKLLGMVFVMKFQAAAMSRAAIPEEHRRDFSLYVDEFQNFSTDSFATILSEARKYRLNLIVANQFITQLTEEIRDAVFGNVGSVVGLRVGVNDAEYLTKQFSPVFDFEDLVKLPNFNAVVRLMINGVPTQSFTMATIPPLGHPNPQLADALKRLSAAKYARTRAVVEKEIFARLQTKVESRPSMSLSSKSNPFDTESLAGRGASTSLPSGGTSFLDEWLAKRRQQQVAATAQSEIPEVDTSLDNEPDETGDKISTARQRPPLEKGSSIQMPKITPATASLRTAQSETKPHDAATVDKEKIPPPLTGPTEFAVAKAKGQLPTAGLSGLETDKEDSSNIAEIVKNQIKTQEIPVFTKKPDAKQPTTNKSDSAIEESPEIEIDEEGNIKFGAGKSSS